MYIDVDKDGRVALCDMTEDQVGVIAIALARLLEQLPPSDQPGFRRLLIEIDRQIKN